MIKRLMALIIAGAFLISITACGHLKRPFKDNPGKKKGHHKYQALKNT